MIDNKVAEAAHHQLLHCKYFRLRVDFLERLEVIPLEGEQVLAFEEFGDELLEEIRSKNGYFLGFVLAQFCIVLTQLTPKST
jgi:hypothetical protein